MILVQFCPKKQIMTLFLFLKKIEIEHRGRIFAFLDEIGLKLSSGISYNTELTKNRNPLAIFVRMAILLYIVPAW